MGLQSRLFRGDPRLEAAAISDPSHIVPGDRGPHVGKIQRALIILDDADIVPDSIYGPATATAVLAYKRNRDIVNRSYQTQADNIVGKMTMASLDSEMLENEQIPTGPILIIPLSPGPSGIVAADTPGKRSTLLLSFGVGLNANLRVDPNVPNAFGPFVKIRIQPRSTGTLEIVNGKGGVVTCNNEPLKGGISEKICQIFDPADPNPPIRPEQQGSQLSAQQMSDGGALNVSNDPHIVTVDGFRPGNAFVHASPANFSAVNTIAVEVRAPKLNNFPGQQTQPLTQTRPGFKFLSAEGRDESVPGSITGGRPVNPKNIPGRRKINISGEGESPGFEDYSLDIAHSGFANKLTAGKTFFRPFTEDRDPSVFIKDGEAGDICIRGVPLHLIPNSTDMIRRIAGSGCRLTFSGGQDSFNLLKAKFNFPPLEEIPNEKLVFEFP